MAIFKEPSKITKILSHDDAVLDYSETKYLVIGGTGQLDVVNRNGVVTPFREHLTQSSWEHLI